MVRVAMIGFGGIAKSVHLNAYNALEKQGKAKLVAVCDISVERFTQRLEINISSSNNNLDSSVKTYTDWEKMLSSETVDMVDICVPTYLHSEIAVSVLNKGYNVFCEKPMSLTFEKCNDMCAAAKKANKKLMIGQCIRFNNFYLFVKEAVEKGTFGKVKTGIFSRLSDPPVWGWENWFMDYSRSGGCILDLHIHDIDFIRYAFGEPKKVSCCTQDIYSKKDIAHSRLIYDDFSILAIGDWSRKGLPFEAGYSVSFEKATVVYSADGLKVYPREGEPYVPEIKDSDMYKKEIEFFADCIENNEENIKNAPESGAVSVKLINTLIESADKQGEIVDFKA